MRILILLLLLTTVANAAPPVRTSTYTSNTTIRSSDVMGNENALFSYLQGGVDSFVDGSIVNADISSSAAIAYSKLSLTNSIRNSDVLSSAAISYSKLDLTGAILNADLAGSIADSKLSTITTAAKVNTSSLTGNVTKVIFNNGTGASSSTFWRGDQTWGAPSQTSNVLFQLDADVDSISRLNNASLTASATGTYSYRTTQAGALSNWVTVASQKFTKISGLSMVTVYAQIWQTGSNTAQLKVDIGGQNSTVSGTSSQTTPEWKSLTIDVSSLTNGSVYDVTIQLSNSDNNGQNINLGNLIAFGS